MARANGVEDTLSASLSLACPHCRAGSDQTVVGLFWDWDEDSWRCLLCGHRTFPKRRLSEAQIQEDMVWEAIFAPEEDGGQPRALEDEPDDSESGSSSSGRPLLTSVEAA